MDSLEKQIQRRRFMNKVLFGIFGSGALAAFGFGIYDTIIGAPDDAKMITQSEYISRLSMSEDTIEVEWVPLERMPNEGALLPSMVAYRPDEGEVHQPIDCYPPEPGFVYRVDEGTGTLYLLADVADSPDDGWSDSTGGGTLLESVRIKLS